MTKARIITTTEAAAEYLPPSPARDELLELVQLGLKFRAQQCGKRPGALAALVLNRARRAGPPYSFSKLLEALEEDALQVGGESCNPVDEVNRVRQVVVIFVPGRARHEVPFATLRRHLTAAKKKLCKEHSRNA